jgi:hypothetical protein
MSNPTLKILPALMVAVSALVAQPVFGGAIEPTLTLTEVSNTQLDWGWDAVGGGSSGSITAVLADEWLNTSISGPTLSGLAEGSATWTEPENAGFHNYANVAYTPTGWIVVTVDSDVIGTGSILDGMATDFGGFQVKFVDNAATSEASVPDTGTTFSLLGLSLMGLGFLRRKIPA